MASSLPRITARVDANTQTLLSKATALAGMTSINSFVLSAAIDKAKQILEREKVLKLNEQDALLLVEALDSPATIHPKLKTAAEKYNNKE